MFTSTQPVSLGYLPAYWVSQAARSWRASGRSRRSHSQPNSAGSRPGAASYDGLEVRSGFSERDVAPFGPFTLTVGWDVAVIAQKASGLGLNARSPRGEIVVADDHAGPRTALRQARASGLSALLCAILPALRRNVPRWGAAKWSVRKIFAGSTRAAEVLSAHSFCRAASHDACTSYIAWAPEGAISA
jgi:hypothetical protein